MFLLTSQITIALLVILTILSVILLLWVPINNIFQKKYFRSRYYLSIKKIVETQDYRLINNFYFQIDENTQAHFDHVIFGEKYIYLITSKFWKEGLLGKPQDESWMYYASKSKHHYIDNPLAKNEIRTEKLSLITGIDRGLFITIVLINDDCLVDEDAKFNPKNIIVKRKKLKKVISNFEHSDVEKINDEQLQKVVYLFDKLKK